MAAVSTSAMQTDFLSGIITPPGSQIQQHHSGKGNIKID